MLLGFFKTLIFVLSKKYVYNYIYFRLRFGEFNKGFKICLALDLYFSLKYILFKFAIPNLS